MFNLRRLFTIALTILAGLGTLRAVTPVAGADLLANERNTIDVFEQAAPSVVFIQSKVFAVKRGFFSYRMQKRPLGAGTGFLWDNVGHVVTNFHVVLNKEEMRLADEFVVTLSNQKSYDAKVVGIAPNKDLAVLKIVSPPKNLRPIGIGSSSNLQVGRKVIAIGNPFGLDQTLTVGVISALGREIESMTKRTIHNVIQTDAAINPGNSGGPLLNSAGQVIGVNTQIFSQTGNNVGIGFAVPVDTVKRVVPQLVKYGKVIRPGIGIRVMPDAQARRRGIEGVVIGNVEPGGAAEKAGLQGFWQDRHGRIYMGDVIVAIDGKRVGNSDEMAHLLEGYRFGDRIKIDYFRKNKRQQVELALQRLD